MSEELKSEVPEKKPCWYVVHTYSGYEKKVQETLQKSVENSPEMQKLIFRVEVPVEDVSEVKNKTAVKTERKVYPGYVMVYMIETTRSWYVVRNTRGVTGFVGPEGKPIALTDEEAYTMLHTKEASASMDFSIGERVRVIDLNDQEATIVDIEPSINKVKVRLDFLNGAEMTLSKEQIRRL